MHAIWQQDSLPHSQSLLPAARYATYRMKVSASTHISALLALLSTHCKGCISILCDGMQPTVKLLIDGEFRESQAAEWVDVTNPVSSPF